MYLAPITSLLLCASLAPAASPSVSAAVQLSSMIKASMAQKIAAKTGAVSELIARARSERDPLLHRIAVSALVKQKLATLRAQKVEILQLVRDPTSGLLPRSPPVPRTGTIEVRHYAMSEFIAGDLAAMKQQGFTVRHTPTGIEARLGRIHVLLRESGDDVLRDLADPKVHVILYNGHSKIGGTLERALAQPGLRGPARRKLLALFQCSGTQSLPFIKAMAPRADVITSNSELFIPETQAFVGQLYAGLEAGDNYPRLNRRFAKVAFDPGRLVSPNQMSTLDHVDFDHDGQLDAQQPAGEIAQLSEQESLRAEKLMSGVHFLRTLNPYYVEQSRKAVFTPAQARTPVLAMGIAREHGRGVTHITSKRGEDGRSFEISLNKKFANAATDFVGAATVFELQLRLQRELAGKNDTRAKARALLFTAEYLTDIPRDRRTSQAALDQITAMNGLPTLKLSALSSALSDDHVFGEDQVTKVVALLGRK